MQYEEGMYYDPATGKHVLLVDFAKWRRILNGDEDSWPTASEEPPASDHANGLPLAADPVLAEALDKLCGG